VRRHYGRDRQSELGVQERQVIAVARRAEDVADATGTCRRAGDSGMEIRAALRVGTDVVPDRRHSLFPTTLQVHSQ